MGIAKAKYDPATGRWSDIQIIDIKKGANVQIKSVYKGSTFVWSAGAFTSATVDNPGFQGFQISAGNYTFNVISSTGSGSGGQIVGAVLSNRRLGSIVTIVDGGTGHSVGDLLTVEMVGLNWNQDPVIEVLAV